MHHRKPVRVNRTTGLLRHEVIHHPQKTRRQKETDRVVAVPPLHHRILRPRIDGVGFPARQRDRNLRAVHQMQQRNRENETAEEPVRHVDVREFAPRDGAEEHDRVRHPDQGDQDVDRPFQLRVFLGSREPERQRDDRKHDHRLPAPERECGETIAEEARVAGSLHDIVGGGEQRASAEREDHRVRMQWTQPAVRQPGNSDTSGLARPAARRRLRQPACLRCPTQRS